MLQFYISNIRRSIILSLLLVAGYYFSTFIAEWLSKETTDNASIDANITLLSPEVDGTLTKILVNENIKVNAGDVLLSIDDTNYSSNLKQTIFDLQNGENDIYNAEYAIKIERLNHSKLKFALESIKLDYNNAEKEFQRTSTLNKDKFISIKTLEDIKYNLVNSKYKLDELQINIDTSEQKINSLTIGKSISIAKLSKLQESVKQAQKKFDDTSLKAKISGIVTNISAKVGNFVKTGVPVLSIVDGNSLYVRANFKETQISHFKPGMEALITIDALPKVELKGIIRNLAPATGSKFSLLPTENATGNFTKVVQRIPVLIDIEIPDEYKNFIVPGMSAYVSIKVK